MSQGGLFREIEQDIGSAGTKAGCV